LFNLGEPGLKGPGSSTKMGGERVTARSTRAGADQVADWWNSVLVGRPGHPHPVHGDAIDVKLRGGVLQLSGELPSDDEREALLREARLYIGRGVDDVDARRLVVKRPDGARGILEQTIIAAFANPALAEHALTFLRAHNRVKPKELGVVRSDREPVLNSLGEFAADIRKALADGSGIVIVRLDETDAFEAIELLDEDTRSMWTVAMPPVPARPGRWMSDAQPHA
jgi:hypothetical protein